MAVVDVRVFQIPTSRGVESDSLGRDSLPGSQGESASFDGILGSHELFRQQHSFTRTKKRTYITVRLSNVGERIRILQSLLARIQRPSSNMHLLTQRSRIRLHERVHVLPAVKVSDTTNLSLHNRLGGVTGSISEDKALNVGSADLATVVNHLASGRDEHLRGVEAGQVQLGVAQGDEDLVRAGGGADLAHFIRVRGKTVLAVGLEEREALLVGHLPGPVGVSGDPWLC